MCELGGGGEGGGGEGASRRERAPSPSRRAWRQVASRTSRSTCRSLSAQCNEEVVCGSAGGQATGCVAGRSRCSVSAQGGCRSVCTSRVCSAVSGAVAAAPAAPASRPGCTVPPAGPAPASWRCQSPCRPLRTHNERGMQGEPTPRLGGRARAPRFELCARTVGSTTNERAVDLRGAEVSGRHSENLPQYEPPSRCFTQGFALLCPLLLSICAKDNERP